MRSAGAGGPVELYVERPEGRPRRLTRDGAHWQRPLRGVACEQVSIPGPAGPIRATVAAPRGASRERLPLILSIIEDALAFAELGEFLTVVTLVTEESGLMTTFKTDTVPSPMLCDDNL